MLFGKDENCREYPLHHALDVTGKDVLEVRKTFAWWMKTVSDTWHLEHTEDFNVEKKEMPVSGTEATDNDIRHFEPVVDECIVDVGDIWGLKHAEKQYLEKQKKQQGKEMETIPSWTRRKDDVRARRFEYVVDEGIVDVGDIGILKNVEKQYLEKPEKQKGEEREMITSWTKGKDKGRHLQHAVDIPNGMTTMVEVVTCWEDETEDVVFMQRSSTTTTSSSGVAPTPECDDRLQHTGALSDLQVDPVANTSHLLQLSHGRGQEVDLYEFRPLVDDPYVDTAYLPRREDSVRDMVHEVAEDVLGELYGRQEMGLGPQSRWAIHRHARAAQSWLAKPWGDTATRCCTRSSPRRMNHGQPVLATRRSLSSSWGGPTVLKGISGHWRRRPLT